MISERGGTSVDSAVDRSWRPYHVIIPYGGCLLHGTNVRNQSNIFHAPKMSQKIFDV